MSTSFRIHTSITSAAAIKAVGEQSVTANWKETKNQTRKERAVILPMECLHAPEVPEQFRALVESALNSTAELVLKDYCNANPNSMEIGSEEFTRQNLVERFLASGNGWMGKDELELAWKESATWARISGNDAFKTNATYRKMAETFKDAILKLSAKPTLYSAEKCDVILAKLEASDLETELGAFVVRRISAMKDRQVSPEDFSAL